MIFSRWLMISLFRPAGRRGRSGRERGRNGGARWGSAIRTECGSQLRGSPGRCRAAAKLGSRARPRAKRKPRQRSQRPGRASLAALWGRGAGIWSTGSARSQLCPRAPTCRPGQPPRRGEMAAAWLPFELVRGGRIPASRAGWGNEYGWRLSLALPRGTAPNWDSQRLVAATRRRCRPPVGSKRWLPQVRRKGAHRWGPGTCG